MSCSCAALYCTVLTNYCVDYLSFHSKSIVAKLILNFKVSRARKAQRFMSQPFHVAEVFTGRAGRFVQVTTSYTAEVMLHGCLQNCSLS